MKRKNILTLAAALLIAFGCTANYSGKPLIGGIRNEKAETTTQAEQGTEHSTGHSTGHVTGAEGLEIPARMKGTPEQILRRTGYTVSYNRETRLPNWVAWRLTASRCKGKAKRQQKEFHEDEEVAAPRATDWTEDTCARQATTNGARKLCTNRSSSRTSVRKTRT